jgi:hypothetical protein
VNLNLSCCVGARGDEKILIFITFLTFIAVNYLCKRRDDASILAANKYTIAQENEAVISNAKETNSGNSASW